MCWQVITHTLGCDVRPIITDGMYNRFIDPFAKPIPCNCHPRSACPDHGCCVRTVEWEYCSQRDCSNYHELHRYNWQPPQIPLHVWGPTNPLFYTLPCDPRPEWPPIKYIDEALFPDVGAPPLQDCAEDFRQLLSDLVVTGRTTAFAQAQYRDMMAKIEAHRQMHADHHATVCENVRTRGPCPMMQPMLEAQQEAKNVRVDIEERLAVQFRRLWEEIGTRIVRQNIIPLVSGFNFQRTGLGML